jgi:hypothetical protein
MNNDGMIVVGFFRFFNRGVTLPEHFITSNFVSRTGTAHLLVHLMQKTSALYSNSIGGTLPTQLGLLTKVNRL